MCIEVPLVMNEIGWEERQSLVALLLINERMYGAKTSVDDTSNVAVIETTVHQK